MSLDAPPRPPSRREAFRRSFLFWPVVAYAAARVTTAALAVVVSLLGHRGSLAALDRWDGVWFIRAAQYGWPTPLPMVDGHVAQNTTAFFPLLPLILRGFNAATSGSFLIVGLILSAVTGLTAVIAVGLVTRHFTDDERARRAALLFALFPGTFAFSLIYSEGFTITLIAFGLLALLKKRWWLAGLLGLLASASSPVGFIFTLSCAWVALRELTTEKNWRALLAPLLSPLGGLAWLGFLWIHEGQFNAWRATERGGWDSYPSLVYPFHILWVVIRHPLSPTLTGVILFLGTIAGIIGGILAIKERQPAPVLIYGIAAAVFAAIAAPVGLRPRFLMLAFPLVIAVGTRYRGMTYRVILASSALLLVVMSAQALWSNAVFP